MRFTKFKELVLGAGLLAGTIIGAGVFALPFVFKEVGFVTGIFYLFFFAAAYFLIHWFYAEVAAESGGKHRFLYYAEEYLGKWSRPIVFLMTVAQMVLVLTVYLVLSLSFTSLVFGDAATPAIYVISFWLLSSLFIFLKIKKLALTEVIAALAIIVLIGLISVLAYGKELNAPNFTAMSWDKFLLPFGPLFFALAGRPAVDELVALTRKGLKGMIFWGTFLPAIAYLIFVWSVLKINPEVAPDTISGLTEMSFVFRMAIGILGLITLWSSYIVIGANINDILKLDLKFSGFLAGFSVVFFPLFLYFAGLHDFFSLVSFVGGLFLGLEGIFIILMWFKMKRKGYLRWLSLLLLPVFVLAIFYIFKFLNI